MIRTRRLYKKVILAIMLFLISNTQCSDSSTGVAESEFQQGPCCEEDSCPSASIGVFHNSTSSTYSLHCLGCSNTNHSVSFTWTVNGTIVEEDKDTDDSGSNVMHPMGNGTVSGVSHLTLLSKDHHYSNITCTLSDVSGSSSDSVVIAYLPE